MPLLSTYGAAAARAFRSNRAAALGGSTTWNPADKDAGVTLTNGNRTMSVAGAGAKAVRGTTSIAPGVGKRYYEATILSTGAWVGTGKSFASLASYVGSDIHATGYSSDGNVYTNGAAIAAFSLFAAGDVISYAVDGAVTGNMWWAKNGVWQGGGDPAAGTGSAVAWDMVHPIFPMASAVSGGSILINCGQDGFEYDPPAGFSQWG